MRELSIQVKDKLGNLKQGTLVYPDTLAELVDLFGAKFVYKYALVAYISQAKRRLASISKPRRKLLKLDLNSLDEEQKSYLFRGGFLREE